VLLVTRRHRPAAAQAHEEFKYGSPTPTSSRPPSGTFGRSSSSAAHADRAAGQLLRARHLPDPQSRPIRTVRPFASGTGLDSISPALGRVRRASVRKRLGRWAFWLYMAACVLCIVFNFFPDRRPHLRCRPTSMGWAMRAGQAFLTHHRLLAWMPCPGDLVFARRALLMAMVFSSSAAPLSQVDRFLALF